MRRCPTRKPRTGNVLVLFLIMLTGLLGMLGLVVDVGLMTSTYRQAQNAADSAALAAAMDQMRGAKIPNSQSLASTFVTNYNGLSDATVVTNIPPSSGPYAGNYRYVEVIVTQPYTPMFIQMVGASTSQQVQARAVAGFEAVASGEGAIVLNPNIKNGIAVSGGATLLVNGSVVVNSQGGGSDQYGVQFTTSVQSPGASASNNSTVKARYVQVAGGVDNPANFVNYDAGGPSPLFCRAPVGPDPLRELPVPTASNVTSIGNWTRIPAITVSSGQSMTFNPGVYEDIQINQGATVTFNPGVYIFSPTKPNEGLRANGSCTITGNGVMFYMTGSDYLNNGTGHWDALDDAQNALDGPLPPTNGSSTLPAAPDPGTVQFATMTINATNANVTLTGLNDQSSPFNDILFFQRRRNTNEASIQGNAGENVNLGGTIYAKWANFKLAGGGKYNAQFVVGSMSISGQATVTINSTGKNFGRANQVFLVQ